MYNRFLTNNDYIGIVTEEALAQLIRGNEERLSQAEEAAEESIIEYLTDNYQIEACLAVGKNLRAHNPQITYPAGAHFIFNGKICEAIRPIGGYKAPMGSPYWQLYTDLPNEDEVKVYSQLLDYVPGDIVKYGNLYYLCLSYNGWNYGDIRVPGINGWGKLENVGAWEANVQYAQWSVKKHNGKFYALLTLDDIDLTKNPHDSANWGLIGDYTPDYTYEFSSHEYVVYNGEVFYPLMNVNADAVSMSFNIKADDPRNANIKKHMLRLAVYELHKLISPNNVSAARITDYETSIMWLRDASKLKINPNIPRRVDDTNRPETEYAIATYARDYDPYKNPWQI